jgi:surfeit locus 1 family protein
VATMNMWAVARRPRWIGALVFALVVAAGFAALSQWQLARSVATGTVIARDTESVVPLSAVAKPQSPVSERANAQLVTVAGRWNAGDYSLVSDRLNEGATGYWVVGHFSAELDSGTTAGLAVAMGWSATRGGGAPAHAGGRPPRPRGAAPRLERRGRAAHRPLHSVRGAAGQ